MLAICIHRVIEINFSTYIDMAFKHFYSKSSSHHKREADNSLAL
jgi:hypothetical protein